ncbi:unnamed protein product [Adineta steineri]|uniref:Glycosyltransferase 61 catalytic domain-containing protein n=1 Tax=Adineta steineri TaxID=433720 RepID=A0A814DPE3_9BILA|nr:unnamed protein product [Adineta steineri]CAF0956169.1 unnamed protein product [Adineta steineri]CAF0961182.1 unnamed protein product [Adineta steineri]
MFYRPLRLLKIISIVLFLIIIIYQLYKISFNLKKYKFIRKEQIISAVSPSSPIPTISINPNEDFQEITETLPPFYVRLPNFSDDEAKSWFYNSSYYKINSKKCPHNSCEKYGVLFNDPKEHLSVKLSFVKNGLYLNDDCGYNYGDDAVRRGFENDNELKTIYDKLFIYTVPDGWSFQHFLDGIGPKLSHSSSYLKKYPDAKVLILKGARFDRSVKEIWSMLGVEESSRIIHHNGNNEIGARLLINPCRTPGIHPRLWHNAREMYWSISNITKSSSESERKNFIYIQRTATNAMNGGRLILNDDLFMNLLKEYCLKKNLNFIQYDHSKDSNHIRYRIELFYNSKYIIGVHSGALSNMNFAQSGTTLIEIMPYRPLKSSLPMTCSMFNPADLKACAGYILYTQSQLLNQTYWILPTAVNNDGNMNVDLNRMKKLLEQI